MSTMAADDMNADSIHPYLVKIMWSMTVNVDRVIFVKTLKFIAAPHQTTHI